MMARGQVIESRGDYQGKSEYFCRLGTVDEGKEWLIPSREKN